jgi:hypothetical protein
MCTGFNWLTKGSNCRLMWTRISIQILSKWAVSYVPEFIKKTSAPRRYLVLLPLRSSAQFPSYCRWGWRSGKEAVILWRLPLLHVSNYFLEIVRFAWNCIPTEAKTDWFRSRNQTSNLNPWVSLSIVHAGLWFYRSSHELDVTNNTLHRIC